MAKVAEAGCDHGEAAFVGGGASPDTAPGTNDFSCKPAPGTRPVVLVHGLGSSAEHGWRPAGWIDLIADAGRTVACVRLGEI